MSLSTNVWTGKWIRESPQIFIERYELLLRRCPGIARHLPLNAIASFLCVTPQQLSRIRKAVTFSEK